MTETVFFLNNSTTAKNSWHFFLTACMNISMPEVLTSSAIPLEQMQKMEELELELEEALVEEEVVPCQ